MDVPVGAVNMLIWLLNDFDIARRKCLLLLLYFTNILCFCIKRAIPGFLFVYFRLFNADLRQLIVNIICRWLDTNQGSLVFEVTTIPTEPLSLPFVMLCLFIWSIGSFSILKKDPTLEDQSFTDISVNQTACHASGLTKYVGKKLGTFDENMHLVNTHLVTHNPRWGTFLVNIKIVKLGPYHWYYTLVLVIFDAQCDQMASLGIFQRLTIYNNGKLPDSINLYFHNFCQTLNEA